MEREKTEEKNASMLECMHSHNSGLAFDDLAANTCVWKRSHLSLSRIPCMAMGGEKEKMGKHKEKNPVKMA